MSPAIVNQIGQNSTVGEKKFFATVKKLHTIQYLIRQHVYVKTKVPRNDSSTESVENTTHVTIVKGRPWSSAEMERLWQTVPSPSTDSEKVFVVTSRTISPSEFGDAKSKKKEDTRKKNKKKKKSYEPIERAYQVLPQAVNNLAVVSTGPENVPLWGIMEHEDFMHDQKSTKSRNDSDKLSPVLYVGHSKVTNFSFPATLLLDSLLL